MTSDTPYQTVLDPKTCVKKGFCTVAQDRSSQPRRLYYELHGSLNASQKLVLIMGLNFPCGAWSHQVHHFANKPDHAVLVIDNRGVGNSDCGVFEIYKTSEMAKDALDLLNYLGWDQDRSIHLFGVSLGGMISQELCLLVPKRMRSVSFISTRGGDVFDYPSRKVLSMFLRVISRTVTRDQGLDLILGNLFPTNYLDRATSDGRTRRDELRDYFKTWHNTPRRQLPAGVFGHISAVFGHCCPPSSLKHIARELAPAKVLVVLGDQDEMICPPRSIELHNNLPGSELVIFKDAGHALSAQFTEEINALFERAMEQGNQACS